VAKLNDDSNVRRLADHPMRATAQAAPLQDPLIDDVPLYRAGVLADGTIAIDFLFAGGVVAPVRIPIDAAPRLLVDLQTLMLVARERVKGLRGDPTWHVAAHPERTEVLLISFAGEQATFLPQEVELEDAMFAICSSCDKDIAAGARAWRSERELDERGHQDVVVFPSAWLCDPCATPRPPHLEIVDLLEGSSR
jgi:hypothetical protein